jgi:hypothetical protein
VPLTQSLIANRCGGTCGPQALTERVQVPATPQQVLIAHTLSAGQSEVEEQGSPQSLGITQAPVPSDVSTQKQFEFGLHLKV